MIFFIEVIFFFIVPFVLLYFGLIPLKQRRKVWLIVFLLFVAALRIENFGLAKLGIRTDNLSATIAPYFIFLILGVAIILFLSRYLNRKPPREWWKDPHFLFFFIPISVFQEVAYRGFLIPKLEMVFSSLFLVIFIDAVLFAFPHAIYPNLKINLPFGFIAGVAFASIYVLYTNLILISLVHIILNFITVRYGFFSVDNSIQSESVINKF